MLYKKDSKGKIRTLEIKADNGNLIQVSGLIKGKKVTHSKLRPPKNVGKKNATTSVEQAEIEKKALITKKIREGYYESEEEALNSVIILPMLAKDYFKERKKIIQKVLNTQPKLDGIRCMMFYEHATDTIKAISRTNVPIENVNHIKRALIKTLKQNNSNRLDIIFDGELYKHGSTFQEVTKLVKNKPELLNPVEYHIYDLISSTLSFSTRSILLKGLLKDPEPFINVVDTKITKLTDIDKAYAKCIKDGYEGMMVRVADSKYKINGRSSDLLKYKEFIDIALPIVDITPNDGNNKHGTVWVDYKGTKVKTGAKLSHSDREELLTNRDYYIGKTAEIRFFEYTDEGSLRFPVYHGIRIDK